MKQYFTLFLIAFISSISLLIAQETEPDYIEFNDRKNTVHGVYLGLSLHYGTIDKADTFISSLKVAYVANQQFEIGFVGTGFYTDLNQLGTDNPNKDLVGFYGGLHLEPIFFGKSKFNLSIPLLIGGGAAGLLNEDVFDDVTVEDDEWKGVFVFEPGVNLLYNINRYIQLEAGVKYRMSSNLSFRPEYSLNNINGFSVGIGVKLGVFNMGRNRYKQKI
ncbi:hypothetical protein [Algibacter mikhailovii]|uniref:hypothetical protein n=1 Tax=Algibacter mikhailovii TaxID=425498 RepID=UPI001677A068|nr:hypothetical protein [Algibacter mikhailovii]